MLFLGGIQVTHSIRRFKQMLRKYQIDSVARISLSHSYTSQTVNLLASRRLEMGQSNIDT